MKTAIYISMYCFLCLLTLFSNTLQAAVHPTLYAVPLVQSFSKTNPPNTSPTSYQLSPHWQKFQTFLPKNYQIHADNKPREYFWQWRQHAVHVDHYPHASAKAKVILIHGLSTHGRHMSLILGAPLARAGYEVFSLDLPLYGLTRSPNKSEVLYEHWVQLVNDFIHHEARKDQLPIFIYGLSAGGMLAYHAAAQNPHVKGIIGSSFLDLSRTEVRRQTVRFHDTLELLLPGLKLGKDTSIRRVHLPLTLVSKVRYTVNNPDAMDSLLQDARSAGNRLSLGFFESFLNYQPTKPTVQQPAILLTQFERDSWTPSKINHVFINSLKQQNVHVIDIPEAGHLPIEAKGLKNLEHVVIRFIEQYR